MQKRISVQSQQLCILFIVSICTLIFATSHSTVQADAAPGPDPMISGIGPYRPRKTNVQMMSETVVIELPSVQLTPVGPNQYEQQINVNASFNMKNQSTTEEKMQVIFPLSRLDGRYNGDYNIIASSFVAKVNGQVVPLTTITTPAEMTYSPQNGDPVTPSEGKFNQDVRWAAFDATFPVHQNVLLEVEYTMGGYGGFTGIDYILETGAGWYGKILSADIILKLPYAATDEIVDHASPGYTFSGNEMRWKMENFEPARKDNMSISVVNALAWSSVLEQRAKMEQNPNDADGWYALGEKYTELAVQFLAGECEYSPAYSLSSTHFADLAAQAYQRAIDLRPDWGDAHLKLANIVWFGNENVNKWATWFNSYNHNGTFQRISPKDPYVQRVLKEISLAPSYSITGDYYACRLHTYLSHAIPSLKLTPYATKNLRSISLSETPTPIPTTLAFPTGTSTPSAKPTPTPKEEPATAINNGWYIGVSSLILLIIFVYVWRSKRP